MTMIFDDYSYRNILNLVNYTSGESFVRNFIVFENSQTEACTLSFAYTRVSTASNINIIIDIQGTSVFYPTAVTSSAVIVDYYNSNATFISSGVSIELYNPYDAVKGVSNAFYLETEAYRLISNGTIEANSITITTSYLNAADGDTLFEDNAYEQELSTDSGLNGKRYWSVPNRQNNNAVFATNATSVLNYGKKLYTLKNSDTIVNTDEIQDALNAKLSELKDPKARCYLDIPFDYNQTTHVSLLTEVEVRLSLQDVSKFGDFKEGGHFKAWTEGEVYRYKTFSVLGIDHSQEGTYTRLRLMEKI